MRLVPETATSRSEAERALRTELTVRPASGVTGTLPPDTHVSALVATGLAINRGWLTGTEGSQRSTQPAQVAWPSGGCTSAR